MVVVFSTKDPAQQRCAPRHIAQPGTDLCRLQRLQYWHDPLAAATAGRKRPIGGRRNVDAVGFAHLSSWLGVSLRRYGRWRGELGLALLVATVF